VVRCGVSFANLPLNHPDNSVISSTGIHIGSLGRLVEKKGFDVLINSVATLRREGHNIVLHLAGDGPLLGELKTQAMSLGISEFVIFEGPLAHNIVSSWMQRMDMFVLACKADQNGDMDGIPVVLMEAMTQYIPVVSTRLSGIPELVRHNETGLLAAPGDSDSLAMEIKRLLDSPDLRRQLATNAQSFVTQEFSQGVNIDRLLSHFH
jgi:glycosyltransferase involved in cell wall biosynthesis